MTVTGEGASSEKTLEKPKKFKKSEISSKRLCKTTLAKTTNVWMNRISKQVLQMGKRQRQTKERNQN
jgi:hypothetical protein